MILSYLIPFSNCSGVFTVMGAIYGLALFRRSGSQKEVSWSFWAYAGILAFAVLLAIISSVMSFMLRESIAHRFYKTDVMVSFSFLHQYRRFVRALILWCTFVSLLTRIIILTIARTQTIRYKPKYQGSLGLVAEGI